MSMLDRLGTNPTQVLGVISFATATIACLSAVWTSAIRDRRTWKVLAFMNGLFLIEVVVGLRFRILELSRASLKAEGLYYQLHGGIQKVTVFSIATLALVSVILALILRPFAGTSARVAVSMTIIVLALFATEAISLHELYAVLYRPIGPVAVIGWLWAVAAAGTALAAFLG